MPTYKVTDPSTGRKLKLTGDSPPTEQELEEIFASQGQAPDPQQDRISGAWEYLGGLSDEFFNTMTFGLADQAAGAGRALATKLFGEEGADVGAAYEAPAIEREQFRAEHPKASLGAGVAGAVINPANLAMGKWVGAAKSIPRAMGRGAVTGATQAGAQSAIEGRGDLAERLERGATGAVVGGTLGGAIPGVIPAVSKLGRYLYNQTIARLPQKQASAAARKMSEALQREGYETIDDAAKALEDMGPDAVYADLGPTMRQLAYKAYGVPGEGRSKLSKALIERQEGIRESGVLQQGQAGRIKEGIEELVPQKYGATKQAIADTNKATDFYKSAYKANQQMESKELDAILRRIDTLEPGLFKNAVRLMRAEGKLVSVSDEELTALARELDMAPTGAGVGKGLKLEVLDKLKKFLGQREDKLVSQAGKATEESRVYTKIRRELTKELDNLDVTGMAGPRSLKPEGGLYAQGRKIAEKKITETQALELGTRFLGKGVTGRAESLGELLADMTPEARHAFRVGAMRALKEKFADIVPRADVTKQLLGKRGMEDKILKTFGDEEMFRKYIKMLQNEEEMFKTYGHLLTGSRTAENLASMEDIVDPGMLAQGMLSMASGGPGNILRGAGQIGRGVGGATGLGTSGPMSGELAKLLLSRGIPKEMIEEFPKELARTGRGKMAQQLLLRAAPEAARPKQGRRR